MFSIADQESYRSALDMVRHLRVDLGLDRAILLVGNKVDLARQRKVAVRGEHAVLGLRRRLSGVMPAGVPSLASVCAGSALLFARQPGCGGGGELAEVVSWLIGSMVVNWLAVVVSWLAVGW